MKLLKKEKKQSIEDFRTVFCDPGSKQLYGDRYPATRTKQEQDL